jgi:hypothetical protein
MTSRPSSEEEEEAGGVVVDEGRLERAVEEGVPNTPSVNELVPDDRRFAEALENFLLLAPERQILQVGGPDALLAAGDAARAVGRTVQARIHYDEAAKFEIYRQNSDGARKFLMLAEEVTEKGGKFSEYHQMLLGDLDRTLRVAKEYYEKRVPASEGVPTVPDKER